MKDCSIASRPPEDHGPVDRSAASDTRARNRWAALQAARLAGVALVILGILITQGVWGFERDQGRVVGYAIIIAGLIDLFVLPQVLARRWRTPK